MALVALAAVLSRVLGFFREMAIAYQFGATMETELAYNQVFRYTDTIIWKLMGKFRGCESI